MHTPVIDRSLLIPAGVPTGGPACFHRRMIPVVLVFLLQAFPLRGQSRVESPVFRDYRPPVASSVRPDLGDQWNAFLLVRKANAGDPVAQHDLGLRYLMGQGFAVDTIRALYWIQKAAGQNLVTARYNYGLLLLNGTGGMWNPFEAFEHFRNAAERDFPEAQYMYGLLFTDELIVRRDWHEAWRWLDKAAKNGFLPASAIIAELFSRHYLSAEDTARVVPDSLQVSPENARVRSHRNRPEKSFGQTGTWSPLFLDFRPDSMKTLLDSATLLAQAIATAGLSTADSMKLIRALEEPDNPDAAVLEPLEAASEQGNPEASIFLAFCFSRGLLGEKQTMRAAMLAIRATWQDSPFAPQVLYELQRDAAFLAGLKNEAFQNNADAAFVWSQLIALDMQHDISERQAFDLLKKSAAQEHADALLHLGLCFSSGRWVKRDRLRALECWRYAADAGSREAIVRMAASRVLQDSSDAELHPDIAVLQAALAEGSIIAEVALARCYETGRNVVQSISEALRLYRHASMRGSRAAYGALRSMYDALRPEGREFHPGM